MIKLTDSLKKWGTPAFEPALKEDIQKLEPGILPLQEGLSQSSYVSDAEISAVILKVTETTHSILVKTGIFYAGIVAGSCCADDPSPACENTEYCELLFEIDKTTAATVISLLDSDSGSLRI